MIEYEFFLAIQIWIIYVGNNWRGQLLEDFQTITGKILQRDGTTDFISYVEKLPLSKNTKSLSCHQRYDAMFTFRMCTKEWNVKIGTNRWRFVVIFLSYTPESV